MSGSSKKGKGKGEFDLSSFLPTSFGKKTSINTAGKKKNHHQQKDKPVIGDDWNALRSMLPASLGKSKSNTITSSTSTREKPQSPPKQPRKEEEEEEVEDVVGPPIPPQKQSMQQRLNEEEKEEEEDLVGPPLPPSIPHQQPENNNNESDSDSDDVGPPLPPSFAKQPATTSSSTSKESSDDSDLSDSEQDNPTILPVTNQVKLKDHHKAISAIHIDPSGTRLITGSLDSQLKVWDFGGMDASFRPFRTVEPWEGNLVKDLAWSISGDGFLACSNSNQMTQPKLFDRDGIEVQEYVKGDMYIRDPRQTKGHTSTLTSVRWHPTSKQYFATSSSDSTIRIWDIEIRYKQKDVIVANPIGKGGRLNISTCAFHQDGKLIAGGCSDGVIRIWSNKAPYSRPAYEFISAHQNGCDIGSILFSIKNPTQFITRASDDTCKLFDLRNPSKAVVGITGLGTFYSDTNAVFSPDEKYVVTGISSRHKPENGGGSSEIGKLLVLNQTTFEPVHELPTPNNTSVIKSLWHPRLNQIFAGCADGSVCAFYDETVSLKGVKDCLAKRPKRIDGIDSMSFVTSGPIMTPHALPMFKDDGGQGMGSKRKRDKGRNDSRKPEMPIAGHGKGGKIGISATQHIMKSIMKDTSHEEDPRQAILRHAEDAEKNPIYVAPAYAKNQPKPVFRDVDDDEDRAMKRRK